MKELKYFKSKKHKNRDRISSSVTVLLSGYFIFGAIQTESFLEITFFGIFLIIGSFQFFNSFFLNRPTFIVNEKGIYSYTNNTRLIEWKFIEGFTIKNSYNKFGFLVVEINDFNEALKGKNFFTRIIMKSNIKQLGSPVVFHHKIFNKFMEEVIEEINLFRKVLESEA